MLFYFVSKSSGWRKRWRTEDGSLHLRVPLTNDGSRAHWKICNIIMLTQEGVKDAGKFVCMQVPRRRDTGTAIMYLWQRSVGLWTWSILSWVKCHHFSFKGHSVSYTTPVLPTCFIIHSLEVLVSGEQLHSISVSSRCSETIGEVKPEGRKVLPVALGLGKPFRLFLSSLSLRSQKSRTQRMVFPEWYSSRALWSWLKGSWWVTKGSILILFWR